MILAFWALISLHFGPLGVSFWGSSTSCQKLTVFPISHTKNLAALRPAPFFNFWPFGPSFPFIFALWAFISLHFGLVGLHFLSFWPCGPSFRCILALWAFVSFHFGLVGFDFLAFWLFESRLHFPIFGLLGLHFLSFWPCGPSFPFILALWAFISLHFGLVGLHFLSFWPCGPSFPFILAL